MAAPVSRREIVTRTQRIFLRPDGIVQTVNVSKVEQTVDDARANVAASFEVGGCVRRPVYVDTTLPAPLSAQAQDYYASPEAAQVFTAVAILATGTLGRIIGNIFLGRKRSDVQMRLFESEEAAIAWLRGFQTHQPGPISPRT